MSYAMRRLLNHLPLHFGVRSDRRLRTAQSQHARLVSFFEGGGVQLYRADPYERRQRRRRAAWSVLRWVTAFAVAWFVLESARALMEF